MAEELEPVRLSITYVDLPLNEFRKILGHFENAYNQVLLAQNPSGRKRVRKEEKLCIRQITAPGTNEIYLVGVVDILILVSKSLDIAKKYWETEKARRDAQASKWNAKKARWDAKTAEKRFRTSLDMEGATEAIISKSHSWAGRFLHEAFQLIDRLERCRAILSVEIHFNGASTRLKK
ncbi:MAG: hypothetical protein ABSA41_03450 [Terriglobia bacterium]|jgi:hypothetical protein